jgi:hypothetical protein
MQYMVLCPICLWGHLVSYVPCTESYSSYRQFDSTTAHSKVYCVCVSRGDDAMSCHAMREEEQERDKTFPRRQSMMHAVAHCVSLLT